MQRFNLFLATLMLSCVFIYAAPTKRIISLSPSLTKELQYLGDEAKLVGCTSYCKTTRPVSIVATALKVNVEKVVALRPNLVVATSMTTPQTIAALKKFGIKVVVFSVPKSFDEICSQFLELGKLIDREAAAQKIILTTQQKIAALTAKGKKNYKIFIQLGANPLFTVIPNTFMNDYIVFAGARNIAENMTSGTITREAVLLKNPDVIFIVTMGNIHQKEKKQWERFTNLTAVRNHKIIIIDSDKACTPTPITFVETLEIIMKSLQ